MNEKEMKLLYCSWCPLDCEHFTEGERLGCLAAVGFWRELQEYQLLRSILG